MRRFFVIVALGAFTFATAAVSADGAPNRTARTPRTVRPVCVAAPDAYAHCHADVVFDGAQPLAKTQPPPSGLSPAQVKRGYGFSTNMNAGAGKTIAIVDAFNGGSAEDDLARFSKQFGLPPCTKRNGCFTKVNQTGGTSYPKGNTAWALEIALDTQWAHAIAPGAKILLVEATDNSIANLLIAEDYARTHADYVSNSWGANEFSSQGVYDTRFEQPGVSVFVSAGDDGTPAEWPSAVPGVVSVGGTHLSVDAAGNLLNESAWSHNLYGAGGGGCSRFATARLAQVAAIGDLCGGKRATPDFSLVGDPMTGVAVFFSQRYYGQRGWFVLGGTSASAPMAAARAATTGLVVDADTIYGDTMNFRDITTGNNGVDCVVGYDLCTGRGSWIGATP